MMTNIPGCVTVFAGYTSGVYVYMTVSYRPLFGGLSFGAVYTRLINLLRRYIVSTTPQVVPVTHHLIGDLT